MCLPLPGATARRGDSSYSWLRPRRESSPARRSTRAGALFRARTLQRLRNRYGWRGASWGDVARGGGFRPELAASRLNVIFVWISQRDRALWNTRGFRVSLAAALLALLPFVSFAQSGRGITVLA